MSSIRGVVFDLDGTLVDSRADIVAAVEHAFAAHGRQPPAPDEILGNVGDGARMLLARSAGLPASDPQTNVLLESFLAYYALHVADHTRLMPGARDCLERLRRLPLAICTNKPRATTDALLRALDLEACFAIVLAGGDLPVNKPAPEPLHVIARRLGVTPHELVMVGDGPQDVECGRAAGARTVGVEGGILPPARLVDSRPDVLIGSLAELPDALARWDAQLAMSR